MTTINATIPPIISILFFLRKLSSVGAGAIGSWAAGSGAACAAGAALGVGSVVCTGPI